LLAEVLRLAEQGLPTFPCVNAPGTDQHKKPHTKNGFKDATTNSATLRAWWGRWPNALIGMPTGKVTNIDVLDLDRKHGKDGVAALNAIMPDWEQRSPVRARSVNGGEHSYFQHRNGNYCSDSVIAPGVDTRSDGGYVIVPPSPGYSWVNGGDLSDTSLLPAWPDDLVLPERKRATTVSARPEAEAELVVAALAVIPNPPELGWGEWKRVAMATWAATHGSEDGFKAFDAWSQKWVNYNADGTRAAWEEVTRSPPNRVGAGTLFFLANEADPDWRARYNATLGFPDIGKKGAVLKTVPNTVVALLKLGIQCKYDLFKLRYLVNGEHIHQFVGEVSDPTLLALSELIHQQFKFHPSMSTTHDAVRTLANHHRFHPVRDYLDGLKWDGVPRIDRWLTIYAGAADTSYTRAVGALFLVAAVRRIRQPGCKFDEILVLESPEQGTDKSQALAILATRPEWFSDNLRLGLPAKETIEALSGHWIVEASELQGMNRSDIERIKAFAATQYDRARMAYDRTVTDAPRQCVVAGTTNSLHYLRDLTGNRRFWPVLVVRFDLVALKRDCDQLWAEAAAREASGASIRLPQELWAAAAAEQQARMVINPFVSVLDRVLRVADAAQVEGDDERGTPMQGKVLTEDLCTIVGLKDPARRTQTHYDLLADAMKQLGWEWKQLRKDGVPKSHYTRGPEPHKRIVVNMESSGEYGVPAKPVARYEGEQGKENLGPPF
jgi:predicted P-loop ATPase